MGSEEEQCDGQAHQAAEDDGEIPLQRIAEHRLPGLLHQDAARG
ncbi:MAG TPA: hypothetical protein PLG04_03985 [Anaerolineaceae bacterium]|nr:hypothetical protein [Anaerolineaceae bacterium]